jgi:hypothetical protein
MIIEALDLGFQVAQFAQGAIQPLVVRTSPVVPYS